MKMKENLFNLKYMMLFSVTLTGMEDSDLKGVLCGTFPAIQTALSSTGKVSQNTNQKNVNENQETFYKYLEEKHNLIPTKGKQLDKTHALAKKIVANSIPNIPHLHISVKGPQQEMYLLYSNMSSVMEFWANTKKNAYSFLSSETTTAINNLFNLDYYTQIFSKLFLKASDLKLSNGMYSKISVEDIEYLNPTDKYSGLPYFANLYGNIIVTAPGFIAINTMTPEEFETLRVKYAQQILPKTNKTSTKQEFNVMDMYSDIVNFFLQNCENYNKYHGVFPIYFWEDTKNEGNYNELRVMYVNLSLMNLIADNIDKIVGTEKENAIFSIYDNLNLENSPLIFTSIFSLDDLNFDRIGKNDSTGIFKVLQASLSKQSPKYQEYIDNLKMLENINKECVSKNNIYNNRAKFCIVAAEMSPANYSIRNSL